MKVALFFSYLSIITCEIGGQIDRYYTGLTQPYSIFWYIDRSICLSSWLGHRMQLSLRVLCGLLNTLSIASDHVSK
jgi:hypothetical protein